MADPNGFDPSTELNKEEVAVLTLVLDVLSWSCDGCTCVWSWTCVFGIDGGRVRVVKGDI